MECPKCFSSNVTKEGSYLYDGERVQRYKCHNENCDVDRFSSRTRFNEKTRHRSRKESFNQRDFIINKYKDDEKEKERILDGEISSKTTDRKKILSKFLEECEVDIDKWEVERFLLNAWDVTMKIGKYNAESIHKTYKDEKGETVHQGKYSAESDNHSETYTNYQIKVWLKPKTKDFDPEVFKAQIIEDITKHSPLIKEIKYKPKNEKNLLVLNLYDAHLGRLSWGEESEGNYDIKIAEKLIFKVVNGLIEKSKGFSPEKILIPVGHDFLNYDYAKPFPQTTNGTPQEADVRWQKMFRIGYKIWFDIIDLLSKNIAPIDVISIPGNHDEQSIFYLSEVLYMKYFNNKNVHINNAPKKRKYYNYGQNLIGVTHGRYEKKTEIHNLMFSDRDAKPFLSKTKFRYFYLGHLHHEKQVQIKSEDYRGMIVEFLPSIAQTDAYEFDRGYSSIRGGTAMVHNHKYGRIAKFNHNIME